jgi:recombination protein RecA
MPSASQLRAQIEAHLLDKIPSALTPLPRLTYPVESTGIREIDELLHGGFPVGAITEIVGPECSGRTSLALTFISGMTQASKVCAWVDISDCLHPESAAALGVDLSRLLWIRTPIPMQAKPASRNKLWSRLEKGLRVVDLLLNAGGFSCIVLDLGSLSAEYASRVPLATWFRFRTTAERTQSNVLLLTQHACAKTSAGLVLRLDEARISGDKQTVFTGLQHRAELARQRFVPNHVLPLRKPPQSVPFAEWQAHTVWGGPR